MTKAPLSTFRPPALPIEITYRFELPDGTERVHLVQLHRKTCALMPTDEQPPEWTSLGRERCENCTLDARHSPWCPPARAVAGVAERFKELPSHTVALTEVTSEDRTYRKRGALANALGSLFGLVMSTSGCPHLDFLRPMARFHLPFATVEDTIVRSTSFHLLRQYRKARRAGSASLDLDAFARQYDAVATVNRGLARRVSAAGGKDSGRNAVVALDVLAKLLHMEIRDELPILDDIFPEG